MSPGGGVGSHGFVHHGPVRLALVSSRVKGAPSAASARPFRRQRRSGVIDARPAERYATIRNT